MSQRKNTKKAQIQIWVRTRFEDTGEVPTARAIEARFDRACRYAKMMREEMRAELVA